MRWRLDTIRALGWDALTRQQEKRLFMAQTFRLRHRFRSVRPGHIPRDCHRRWPGWIPF